MKSKKVVARAILEWVDGLNHTPKIMTVADTLEEAEQVEKLLRESLERAELDIKRGAKG